MLADVLDETEAEYQRRLDREARRHRTPWWKRLRKRLWLRLCCSPEFDNVDDLIAWLRK